MQPAFEQYNHEKDKAPILEEDVTWSGWPTEFDKLDRRALARNAGFDPDDDSLRAGRLLRDWTSTSGQTHPKGALVLTPNPDLANLPAGQHFAISKELI
jgi:hypothetical protein